MNITLPDTILRNDEIINIKKQDKEKQPKIISDTIPTLVQDIDGKWIKNPLFIQDTDGMWIKNPDCQVDCNN